MKFIFIFTLFFNSFLFFGQTDSSITLKQDSLFIEKIITLKVDSFKIEGTLLVPDTNHKYPVALIISGSGPTDRNGNNILMQNNSLKLLARGLAENNIASLRYDKRGIAKSKIKNLKESDMRFEDYINDAIAWAKKLKSDTHFTKLTIIGHSEGALIGMIATLKSGADKYISLAGTGKPANQLIREQLKAQPEYINKAALSILEILERSDTTNNVSPLLSSLFRPDIQPYLISWFKYDPAVEVKKLHVPVLLITGTTDIQVSKENLDLLKNAKTDADTVIISGMNHVLKEAPLDRLKNLESYYNPNLPLATGLINKIVNFIKK